MLARIALAFLVAVSSLSYAEVTELSCVQTAPTEYTLSFSRTGNTHEVQIFASTDAAGLKSMQPVLKTSRTQVTVHAGKAGERIYFFLKPDHGEQREVSIRHIPLEGTPNFRDLGGYETTDGRFVRWGLLYRSGVLGGLTPSDLTYLRQLDVRVVCDFRTPEENAASPEKWISNSDVQHIHVPIGTKLGAKSDSQANATTQLMAGNPTPAQLRVRMEKTYADFVLDAAPQYATVFKQLEQDHLPLLYHCTAGKDRTGVFSALVLLSLGVPEQTVFQDYTLTNKYFADAPHQGNGTPGAVAKGQKELASLSPQQIHVLMEADPAALENALKAIDGKYGSFDNYRRQALGVSDGDLKDLKARLLTK
jgi:protein-tyrosine phosphatase